MCNKKKMLNLGALLLYSLIESSSENTNGCPEQKKKKKDKNQPVKKVKAITLPGHPHSKIRCTDRKQQWKEWTLSISSSH